MYRKLLTRNHLHKPGLSLVAKTIVLLASAGLLTAVTPTIPTYAQPLIQSSQHPQLAVTPAQSPGDNPPINISSCSTIVGVCVELSDSQSIRKVNAVSPTPLGNVTYCVYYKSGKQSGGWDADDTRPATTLTVNGLFVIDCYRSSARMTGYPRLLVHRARSSIPGSVVNAYEVASWGKWRLSFRSISTDVAPATRQVVGTETWFAYTTNTAYRVARFQAGRTWASVSRQFDRVTWDFGSYGKLVCTSSQDYAKTWDPTKSSAQQSSNCTHTFTNAPAAGTLLATVTVSWRVTWTGSGETGWHSLGTISQSTIKVLNVVDLQAALT